MYRTFSVFLISAVLITVVVGRVSARYNAVNQDEADKLLVEEYLKTTPEIEYHYDFRFTGKFRPIPDDLKSDLQQAFPEYRFLIAKVLGIFHPPYKEYHMILVIDSKSNVVKSFVWGEFWMLPTASTFKNILKEHKVKSKEEAINHVKLLARLILYTIDGEVGDAAIQGETLRISLLTTKTKPISTLEVKVNKKFRFGVLYNRRIDNGRWW
jgi:hypothetical protein